MSKKIIEYGVGISKYSHELLSREQADIKKRGVKVTKREIVDKLIISAYGGGNGVAGEVKNV